jgi:hypothetical protein
VAKYHVRSNVLQETRGEKALSPIGKLSRRWFVEFPQALNDRALVGSIAKSAALLKPKVSPR